MSDAELCKCGAAADEIIFDRSICPEPCGLMHYYCAECDALAVDEHCPWEESLTSDSSESA